MAVSTIDGTLVEAEPGRQAAGIRVFRKLVFRLDSGEEQIVSKALTNSKLAERLQPGAKGRFYLFKAIDHRGVHGVRLVDGEPLHAFPKNNERISLILLIVMVAWIAGALILVGGLPIFATIMVLFGVPYYVLIVNMRGEARRQFEGDAAYRPRAIDPASGAPPG